MILNENERLEDLQCDNLKIIQNKDLYTFTSDSVVLANYIKTKPNDIAVEIGSGCGVISILVQAKNHLKKIFAFEIQKQMQDLCEKNIKLNKLENKIELVRDDIENFEKCLKIGSADVVFSNPPYFKTTNFEQKEVKKIAKEEIFLPLNKLIDCASKLLKSRGCFYCCYSAERICELIVECEKNKLAVKELLFTENGKGEVKLALIKAIKNGRSGCKVFPNLVTNESDGQYLDKLKTRNFKKLW